MIKRLIPLTFSLVFALLITPTAFMQTTEPIVIISEIAWMGTTVSASDEWIELRNLSSTDVDLTGWMLTTTDGTPTITLDGTIPAQGHFLLERTDDNTTSVLADMVYTGALGNTGELLTLTNTIGDAIDTAGASDGWIAGDNSNKLTMERVDVSSNGTSSTAWGNSTARGGTPQNSVVDSDNDGYGYSINVDWDGEDCNDTNDTTHPTAPELLDVTDNNCNVEIDEGFNLGMLQYETYFSGVETMIALSPSDEISEIEQAILDTINGAQNTLDIAIYDFTRPSIKDALIDAHGRGVIVHIVTNYGNDVCEVARKRSVQSLFTPYTLSAIPYERIAEVDALTETCEVMGELIDAGIEVRPSTSVSYLQHNKFIVSDGETVLTGSSNWTDTGLTYNVNNTIILYSPHIATAYTIEFDEMWDGQFATAKTDNTPHHFEFEQGIVEIYFSPSDDVGGRMVDLVDSATESINFQVFFWTADEVGQAVADRFTNDGIDVKGTWDALGARNQYSEDDLLCDAGIPLKVELGGGKMHSKIAIIDADSDTPRLLTGSYNWSASGTDNNDENSLIFTGFNELIQVYTDQLNAVYDALPQQAICNSANISAESGLAACSDNKDNDFDDLVDAADPNCQESTLTTCTDGEDNDSDGFRDGDDADCFLAQFVETSPLQVVISSDVSAENHTIATSVWVLGVIVAILTATITVPTNESHSTRFR